MPGHLHNDVSSGVRSQFLADNPSQRILEMWRFTVEVFPQRRIDERLLAGRITGGFRHLKKAVHNLLV